MGFIVAIDGPAGSGKGTVTKIVAEKENLISVDTGAMYRCVTLYMLRNKIKLNDIEKINEMLDKIEINMTEENLEKKFYLNGEDVSLEIRTKDVNNNVSQISHIVEIRKNMVELQRKLAKNGDFILEGRDIGTNVFPNADIKIYLDATPEERARRRLKQNEEKGLLNETYEEILENVKMRDNTDKTSDVAPLKQAEDAIYIDTSNKTIDEVTNMIVEIINKKRG